MESTEIVAVNMLVTAAASWQLALIMKANWSVSWVDCASLKEHSPHLISSHMNWTELNWIWSATSVTGDRNRIITKKRNF